MFKHKLSTYAVKSLNFLKFEYTLIDKLYHFHSWIRISENIHKFEKGIKWNDTKHMHLQSFGSFLLLWCILTYTNKIHAMIHSPFVVQLNCMIKWDCASVGSEKFLVFRQKHCPQNCAINKRIGNPFVVVAIFSHTHTDIHPKNFNLRITLIKWHLPAFVFCRQNSF